MLPILFILVAFSCATEDAVVYDRGTSSPPSARIINADEIHAIPGLESIVSKLNRRSSAVGRPVSSAHYNFEIDTEQALLIEQDGYRSFTFPVRYDADGETLMNLFLHPYGDKFIPYLLTYKLSAGNMAKLNEGTLTNETLPDLMVQPLSDLDADLGVDYENLTTFSFPVQISLGSGSGSGFWWVTSQLYYSIIDLHPRGGEDDANAEPMSLLFNPPPKDPRNPVAGYPHPIMGIVSPELPKGGNKNCEELKKISQQIAVSNALKDLKNRIRASQEVGYSFHSQGLSTTTQIHYGDMNGSSVNIPDGGDIYGGGHVHYNDGTPIIGASVPMFSPEDIIKLFRFIYKYNYNGANQYDLINKFVFMVTTNQGTYAIKPNSMLFRTKLFAIYHDEEKKEKFIMKLRNAQSGKKTSDSPESFQKQFLDFAAAENLELSLYKANSEFTQWAKLSVDTDSSTGIKEENCN